MATKKKTTNKTECPPEWVVKAVVRDTNMCTIGWSAVTLEGLVQKHQIGVKQAVVFVNRACDRIRVVVRSDDMPYLLMCPVDTEAVIWNSPHQILLYFTRWLYKQHSCKWSQMELLAFIDLLSKGEEWYHGVGRNGGRRRSSRKGQKTKSRTIVKQTIIDATVR